MVTRIKVALEQPEYNGLLEIANQELRNPQDQLRHILREELKRRGLLPNDYPQRRSKKEQKSDQVIA
jgi:hypothetical protein